MFYHKKIVYFLIFVFLFLSFQSNLFAGDEPGVIFQYNGKEWNKAKFQPKNVLWGIWGSDSNNIFAVGRKGVIVHYDGNTWREMETITTNELETVWGASPKNVFAEQALFLLLFGMGLPND